MARLRSFTITFSQVSDELKGWSASAVSNRRFAVFSFWLWQETQYWFTSSPAGVAPHAANENALAASHSFVIEVLLGSALVLGLARVSELGIGAMLEEQIR